MENNILKNQWHKIEFALVLFCIGIVGISTAFAQHVTRSMPEFYDPGDTITVTLTYDPSDLNNPVGYDIIDRLPASWNQVTPTNLTKNGTAVGAPKATAAAGGGQFSFCEDNTTEPVTFSYDVAIPASAGGTYTFPTDDESVTLTYAFGGSIVPESIGGDQSIEQTPIVTREFSSQKYAAGSLLTVILTYDPSGLANPVGYTIVDTLPNMWNDITPINLVQVGGTPGASLTAAPGKIQIDHDDDSTTPITFTYDIPVPEQSDQTAVFSIDQEAATLTYDSGATIVQQRIGGRSEIEYNPIAVLTVNANNGQVSGIGTGEFEPGSQVTLTATPNAHYHFVRWEGDVQSTSNPLIFNIDESMTLTAIFEIDKHEIAASANKQGIFSYGTVSGTGSFGYGSQIMLEATPVEGAMFVRWETKDGDIVGTENPVYMQLTDDIELVAVFRPEFHSADADQDGRVSALEKARYTGTAIAIVQQGLTNDYQYYWDSELGAFQPGTAE